MLNVMRGVTLAVALAIGSGLAMAETAPDALVKQVSTEVIDAVKADKTVQSGDLKKIMSLVDAKILPHVNFQRMTSSAVGRYWRQATPDQQARLQQEFKALLVRTYSGALTEVKDQTIEFKPVRSRPGDTEVVVRSVVKGKGDPIQLDYRMEKAGEDWRIYDVNVMGVWLVENYRSSFAQEISSSGIDGLIAKLAAKNKAAPAGAAAKS